MKSKTKKYWKKVLWNLKNPVKAYKKAIMEGIIPKPYSHQVKMNVNVKKGQKSGTALIPCTIYAMDHSIDLNPALIRKKDKKMIKFVKAKKGMSFIEDETLENYVIKGKKIYYNPNKIAVKLTEEEEGKFTFEKVTMQEYERCDKCAQKLVLSEVKQTRYRSCPEIHVKLADPAKEDTVIPVEFGVNKSDIIVKPFIFGLCVLVLLYFSLTMIGITITLPSIQGISLSLPSVFNTQVPSWIPILAVVLILVYIWGFIVPKIVYGAVALIKWYNQVKKHMKKSKYANYQ